MFPFNLSLKGQTYDLPLISQNVQDIGGLINISGNLNAWQINQHLNKLLIIIPPGFSASSALRSCSLNGVLYCLLLTGLE